MSDVTLEVLAQQVDVLAGAVAKLELQRDTLLKMLNRAEVVERCGFPSKDLIDLKYPNRAILAEGKHRADRDKRVHEAERERAIDALIHAAAVRSRYRELTGEEMPEE